MNAGVCVPNGVLGEFRGWEAREAWARGIAVARLAERLGFESVWIPDHLQAIAGDPAAPVFEAFAQMAALAAATRRVRLVPGVACAGFRNPALLAKQFATLDVASDGRVEIGIGAGWNEAEWRAYGYGFPDAGDRLRILEDTLEVVARLRQPGPATWSGHHARLAGAVCAPAGVQPRIPVVVGGNGQRVTWRLAARHADELNLDAPTVAQVAAWLPVIRQRCEEIGRDPATLRVSAQVWWSDVFSPSRVDTVGPERVETLGRLADLGLARIHSDLVGAAASDEPLHQFAEDCRAAGVALAPAPGTEEA